MFIELKTYEGMDVHIHVYLASELVGVALPQQLYPWSKSSRHTWEKMLGALHIRSGRHGEEKNLDRN
jgi:hypothetical protein